MLNKGLNVFFHPPPQFFNYMSVFFFSEAVNRIKAVSGQASSTPAGVFQQMHSCTELLTLLRLS